MQFVVTGAPGGDVRYFQKWDQGHLVENSLGDAPEPEVTMTSSYADSTAVAKGEVNAQTAFMTGKVRATGNMAKLMSLMPLTTAPDYREWEEKVRALDVEY
jgi:putative sterol carrier protein